MNSTLSTEVGQSLPTAVIHAEEQEQAGAWTTEIRPYRSLLHFPWKEIWDYRELIALLVHRDFISQYKQTVLGSIWYVLQPLFQALMFTLVFSNIAKISTGHIPAILFFLSGTVCWRYFQDSVTRTGDTFISNTHIFDKVYFPRLVMPIAQLIVNLVGFSMQLALFFIFYIFFLIKGAPIHMDWRVIVLPVLLLQMAALGLGIGCIVSAIATRYRDLQILMGFLIQLWMYASCVVYPLSAVPQSFRWVYAFNPMVSVIEAFRCAFLGQGTVTWLQVTLGAGLSLFILFFGLIMFNKAERTSVDMV